MDVTSATCRLVARGSSRRATNPSKHPRTLELSDQIEELVPFTLVCTAGELASRLQGSRTPCSEPVARGTGRPRGDKAVPRSPERASCRYPVPWCVWSPPPAVRRWPVPDTSDAAILYQLQLPHELGHHHVRVVVRLQDEGRGR